MTKKGDTTKIGNWTIRGVSQETRAAVRVAARKDGMTMGAWIDDVLIREATNRNKALAGEVGPTMETVMAKLLEHMEKTETRAEEMSKRLESLETRKKWRLWPRP